MFGSSMGVGSFVVLNLITSMTWVSNEKHDKTNEKMIDDKLRYTISKNFTVWVKVDCKRNLFTW